MCPHDMCYTFIIPPGFLYYVLATPLTETEESHAAHQG